MFLTLPDDEVVREDRRPFVDLVLAVRMKFPSFVMEVFASRKGNSFSIANKASAAVGK